MVREMLTLVQGDVLEQFVHVPDGIDSDSQTTNLAFRQLVVGIIAGERGMVEIGADPGLAVLQQEPVPLVGGLGGAEPGDLPPGPEAAAIHIWVGAPGEGILPRTAHVPVEVERRGVGWSVDRFYIQA